LHSLYFSPEQPASFSSYSKLSKAVKATGSRIKESAIREWLKQQPVQTLHAPARKRYPRAPIVVRGIDDQWEMDLVEMIPLSHFNNGNKYILTCIDVLSKYAWAKALKNKSANEVVRAFNCILRNAQRKPRTIRTDRGKEFLNSSFRNLCADKGILSFTTNSEQKAAVIERWNRTLKSKMWRYFYASSTLKWVDVLPKLVKSYNQTYHRSIAMPPMQVNKQNETQVWMTLYNGRTPETVQRLRAPKFCVGQSVRISNSPRLFRKGYKSNWSEEVFTVLERAAKHYPYMYKISGMKGDEIQGLFHEFELQAVPDSQKLWVIEKVLKTEKRGGVMRYKVKWAGYDSVGWINETDLRKV
jgi:hypothetical protein